MNDTTNSNDKFMAIVWGTFIPFCFLFGKILYTEYLNVNNPDYVGAAPDFLAFWAAAKMAIAGQFPEAYDAAKLIIVQREAYNNFNIFLPWLNPPVFFFYVYLFGYLNFFTAYISWIMLSSLLCIWACSRLISLKLIFPAIFCTFPYYACFANGQSSILLAALFAAMAFCLLFKKQLTAGLIIALMLFKPQYGLLIPFALIAGKEWKSLFSATLGSLIILGATVYCFGIDSWLALYQENSSFFQRQISHPDTHEEFALLYSVYGVIRYWFNAPYETAMAVQGIVSIICIFLTFMVWRNKRMTYEIKISTLIICSILFNYYVYWHDLFLLTVPVILLLKTQTNENMIRHENILFVSLIYMTFLTNAIDGQIMFLPFAVIVFVLYKRYSFFNRILHDPQA